MLYLGLGLFAEGRTDHRFLPEVLGKSAFNLCPCGTGAEVEIGPVLQRALLELRYLEHAVV